MEALFLRFPHLSKKIFGNLKNRSLSNLRKVNKSWNLYLSNEKWYEIRILKSLMIEMCPGIGYNVMKITHKWPKETIRDLKQAVCQLYEKQQWSNNRGSKKLHFAAAVGHQLFFEALFNVLGNNHKNHRNFDARTPLHYAAMRGHLSVCKYIMEHVTDKNPMDNYEKIPLHDAAMNGHLHVCKYIMEQVTDKNPRDIGGCTPLHFAAMNGHLPICEYIMEQVTDMN